MYEGMSNVLKNLGSYFKDMANPVTIITIITLAAVVVLLLATRKKSGYNTKTLTYGAILISISFILSMIKVPMPQGGSITPASMLPIFIFAYIAGWRAGIIAGICYGVLQFIQAPIFYNPIQFLLDYILAFGLLGFAGILRKNINYIVLICITGGLLRFICHYISGVVFFASYAPKGQSVYLYSLLYNGAYMFPEIIICVVLAIGILILPGLRTAVDKAKMQ
jgi:thiamine transporter